MALGSPIQPSALAVARHYADLLAGFVLDRVDENQVSRIDDLNMRTLVTDTWMKTRQDRRRLAEEVIEFGSAI